MSRLRLTIAGITVAILGAIGLASCFLLRAPSGPPPDADLPAAISPAEFARAKDQFEAAYKKKADPHDVYSWLGESAFNEKRWDVAVASCEQIPSDTPRYGHAARLLQGRALLKLHRLRKAEENLWLFLKLEQDSAQLPLEHFAEALLQLAYILGIELRFEDRKPILLKLIELGAAEEQEVLNYCFPTLHRWNGSQAAATLEEFWKQDPQDARLRVELARYRTGQGRLDEAREMLEACRRDYPKSVSTAAALLACLHEQEEWEEMAKIAEQLPPPDEKHPWLLSRMRGHLHNHDNKFKESIACFELVLQSNPTDVESWLGIGAAYEGINNAEQQRACLRKARELSRIQNRIGWALDRSDDAEALLEIAEIAASIDLSAEAALVVDCGLKKHPKHEKLLLLKQQLQSKGDAS